LELKRKQFNSV